MHARCEVGENSEITSKSYLSQQSGLPFRPLSRLCGCRTFFLYTKLRNVAGVAQTEAKKSSDLFAKCQYLDELTGGRGVVFATGTPISNSMAELYTMMRYLQYGMLQERGA